MVKSWIYTIIIHKHQHHADYDFNSMLALVLDDINMAANPMLFKDNTQKKLVQAIQLEILSQNKLNSITYLPIAPTMVHSHFKKSTIFINLQHSKFNKFAISKIKNHEKIWTLQKYGVFQLIGHFLVQANTFFSPKQWENHIWHGFHPFHVWYGFHFQIELQAFGKC